MVLAGLALLTGGKTTASGAAPQLIQTGEALHDPSSPQSRGGGGDAFGALVALAADGEVAAIAAPEDAVGRGEIYLYDRSSAGGWFLTRTFQGEGEGGSGLGTKLALSEDGGALVATSFPFAHSAWAYRLSQGPGTAEKLPEPAGILGSRFVGGVAVSADGTTAAVGWDGPGFSVVAIYGYNSGRWTIEAQLSSLGAGAGAGESLALTPDGRTLVVGATGSGAGEAFVFDSTEPGHWQQAASLTPEETFTSFSEFGSSVAISSDGQIVLVGSAGGSAAWTFERTGSGWVQNAAPITSDTPISDIEFFGQKVALSSDGGQALVSGSPDHTALFRWNGQTWQQDGLPLAPREELVAREPWTSVALSGDGATAIVGSPSEVSAWIFEDGEPAAATVTQVQPGYVKARGGDTVLLRGHDLTGAKAVRFGPSLAAFTVESEETIRATVPEGVARVHVTVQTAEGWTHPTSADEVEYVSPGPPPSIKKTSAKKGPASGGTTVTITGENLLGVTGVMFGSQSAVQLHDVSESEISVVAPPNTAETVPITITNPNGTSTPSSKHVFKYERPIVTGLSQHSGPVAGGSTITISGYGFKPGTNTTSFLFGKTGSGYVECAATTSCTAVVPPAAKAGTLDVTATVGKAKGKKNPVIDSFTYE